jgi:hypothetical protein
VLARGVADHLLERAEAPNALTVVPDWGADPVSGAAVIAALRAEGFTVTEGGRRAEAGTLVLEVTTLQSATHRVLVLRTREPPAWEARCAFGDATWVDQAGPFDVQAQSRVLTDRSHAVAEARERAAQGVLVRAGLGRGDLTPETTLVGLPQRAFVGEAEVDGRPLYRAWVEIAASEGALRDLRETFLRRQRRVALEPFLRGGVALLFSVALGLGYLRADFGTRGYMTGRLRLLFGTLLVIGLGLCLRIPL